MQYSQLLPFVFPSNRNRKLVYNGELLTCSTGDKAHKNLAIYVTREYKDIHFKVFRPEGAEEEVYPDILPLDVSNIEVCPTTGVIVMRSATYQQNILSGESNWEFLSQELRSYYELFTRLLFPSFIRINNIKFRAFFKTKAFATVVMGTPSLPCPLMHPDIQDMFSYSTIHLEHKTKAFWEVVPYQYIAEDNPKLRDNHMLFMWSLISLILRNKGYQTLDTTGITDETAAYFKAASNLIKGGNL